MKNSGHTDEETHVYSEGVRRGGTLVSAKVPDDHVAQAEAILDRNKSVETTSRGAAYRSGEWSSFDPAAPAGTADEIERERSGYTTTSATERY